MRVVNDTVLFTEVGALVNLLTGELCNSGNVDEFKGESASDLFQYCKRHEYKDFAIGANKLIEIYMEDDKVGLSGFDKHFFTLGAVQDYFKARNGKRFRLRDSQDLILEITVKPNTSTSTMIDILNNGLRLSVVYRFSDYYIVVYSLFSGYFRVLLCIDFNNNIRFVKFKVTFSRQSDFEVVCGIKQDESLAARFSLCCLPW